MYVFDGQPKWSFADWKNSIHVQITLEIFYITIHAKGTAHKIQKFIF